jgi:hypothetical protein
VTDARKELEASATLGETSLWIEALAGESEEEIARLTRVLSTEIDRSLEDSSQAVPLPAGPG